MLDMACIGCLVDVCYIRHVSAVWWVYVRSDMSQLSGGCMLDMACIGCSADVM